LLGQGADCGAFNANDAAVMGINVPRMVVVRELESAFAQHRFNSERARS